LHFLLKYLLLTKNFVLRHSTTCLDKLQDSVLCGASGECAFGEPSLQGGIRRCASTVGIRSAGARLTPRPWRLMRTECHAAFPGVPRKCIAPSARNSVCGTTRKLGWLAKGAAASAPNASRNQPLPRGAAFLSSIFVASQKNDVDIVLRRGVWYYTHHLLGIDVADATIEKQASGLALRQD